MTSPLILHEPFVDREVKTCQTKKCWKLTLNTRKISARQEV